MTPRRDDEEVKQNWNFNQTSILEIEMFLSNYKLLDKPWKSKVQIQNIAK